MGGEGVEMAPADQALVLAPPGGALVLRPGDDAGGAEAADRQLLDRARLRGGEDEPAAHVLALIVALRRAGADVDQVGVGAARDAVLGEADRLVGPGGDPLLPLPQFGEARVPAGPRALGAVEDAAVGGQREDLDALEADCAQPVADRLGGGAKALRAAHPVILRERPHRAQRRRSRKLGADRLGLGARQQRRRRETG